MPNVKEAKEYSDNVLIALGGELSRKFIPHSTA